MTASRIVVQLFPELTNVNGDAENALVLVRRMEWGGHSAELIALAPGDEPPEDRPAAVVLGSGVDSTLARTREALEVVRPALARWVGAGVPLLAVGTGFELLLERIELPGETLLGLGLVAGEARPLAARATGELLVESGGRTLSGFENHARGVRLAAAQALGVVRAGIGNGDGREGVRSGSILGTHLHGPVLARNPGLADEILAAAGILPGGNERAERVDALAAAELARSERDAR